MEAAQVSDIATVDRPATEKAAETRPKDGWDKLDVIGKLLGAILTATVTIVLGIIGFRVNSELGNLNKNFQDAQLKASQVDFLAKRQMETCQMRGQAFDSLAKNVASLIGSDDEKKVAVLAGFHSSYGEFFDTRPVFEALAKQFESKHSKDSQVELVRLAQRVAAQQLDTIALRDGVIAPPISIPVDAHGRGASNPFTIVDHSVVLKVTGVSHSDTNKAAHAVNIEVLLKEEQGNKYKPRANFIASYFDSPYWDNIVLDKEEGERHHLAVVLDDLQQNGNGHTVVLKVVHFKKDSFSGLMSGKKAFNEFQGRNELPAE